MSTELPIIEAPEKISGRWTKWYEKRPGDPKALYWWRTGPRDFNGVIAQPQWASMMSYCGIGYAENEYWPEYSTWNGYRRSVPEDLEWMPVEEGVKKGDEIWNGLHVLLCPFCGSGTKIRWWCRAQDGGLWCHAPPWSANSFEISCRGCFAETPSRALSDVLRVWNRRAVLTTD